MDFGPVTIDRRTTLEMELREAKCKGFAPGIAELYENWQPKKDWSGRDVSLHVLKIAALCAILQGHDYIEKSDWDFAVAFMEWQGRIRQTFAPSRAKKTTQAEFNEIVIKEMQKRTKKGLSKDVHKDKHIEVALVDGKKRVYVRWKGMANDGKWYEHGLDIKKTLNNLVEGGTLEYKSEPVHDDQGKYLKDEVNNAWVRIVGWKPE